MSGSRAVEVMIFGKGGFEGSLMFTSQHIAIGREPAAMVRLDDSTVSLRHAQLFFEGDNLHVKDLASRTGTRVNGAPVTAGALKATDEIGIGPYRLRFTIHRTTADAADGPKSGLGALVLPTPMEGVPAAKASHTAAVAERPKRETARPPGPIRPRLPSDDEETAIVKNPTVPPAARNDMRMDPPLMRPGTVPLAMMPMRAPAIPREEEPPTRAQAAVAPLFAPPAAAPSHGPHASHGHAAPPAFAPFSQAPQPQAPMPPAAFNSGPGLGAFGPPSSAAAVTPVETPVKATDGPSLDARHPPHFRDEPLPYVLPALPSRPRDDDEDDEDEDDANFVVPFDLLEALSNGGLTPGAPADPSLVAVEVVQFRGDRVLSVRHLGAQPLRDPGTKNLLGGRAVDGTFELYPKACPGGMTVRQGKRSAPTNDPTIRLVPGMQVVVDLGSNEGFMCHLVPRAPQLLPPKADFRPSPERIGPTVTSLGMHIGVAVLMGLLVLGGKTEAAADVNQGRFATIDVKEIELEPPPPKPPEPDPPPTPETPPNEPQTPMPDLPRTHSQKTPKGAKGSPQASSGQPSAAASKILSALGGVAGPATVNVETISNLDAIPHGTAGFKVSGVVGKAPGDTLRVGAGGGDAQINTKSASEIGNVGKVHAQSNGDGVVRARVTTAPPAMQGEGHLDRGEIQRVINAHIYQVQGCYERQLMKDPSLSGKVSFQWLITPSGAVSNVRVGQSTLRSVEATSCIQGAIAGWKFPQPQGGSVTVTYPFSFVGN